MEEVYIQGTIVFKSEKERSISRPWHFEIIPDFFKQSNIEDDLTSFDYIKDDFGIMKSWNEITNDITNLNANSKENESYKILFLARHGQGWHNFAMTKYGYNEWISKGIGKLSGDDEITWGPDALLTELGISQAKDNNYAWKQQLKKGAPLPSKWYSSPFTRFCDTLVHTWSDIVLVESELPQKINPTIKEDLREVIGVHQCDKRSSRSVIESRFNKYGFVFEPNFDEEDIYFKDDYREQFHEHCLRVDNFLQYLFENDKDDEYISITSHAGTTRALLTVLEHRRIPIATGAMIPVAVKATKLF